MASWVGLTATPIRRQGRLFNAMPAVGPIAKASTWRIDSSNPAVRISLTNDFTVSAEKNKTARTCPVRNAATAVTGRLREGVAW